MEAKSSPAKVPQKMPRLAPVRRKSGRPSDAELRRQCEAANKMDRKEDDFWSGVAVWP